MDLSYRSSMIKRDFLLFTSNSPQLNSPPYDEAYRKLHRATFFRQSNK